VRAADDTAGEVAAVVGMRVAGQAEEWPMPSVTMLSHCINMSEIRLSTEMVLMSKLGRAMIQRRRTVWEWKRSWYL
jgi:hypothetical protein